jgi:predicted N-formylglutamate amidohydrolase
MSAEAVQIVGAMRAGGVLIIADHASNHVPADIDLGVPSAWLDLHIALDIGVDPVARALVGQGAADAAVLGGSSRLVIDLNREPDHPGLIPAASDGRSITGNATLTLQERAQRIVRFYAPYHDLLTCELNDNRPAMIVSLHSFTPALASAPDTARPWDVGILYNRDTRLVAPAIASLTASGRHVGDQQPYSGAQLNATMNRHGEANDIPYVGIEMRQDHVGDGAGVGLFARDLAKMIADCRNSLA